jgi:hypothetical protein
MRSIGWFLGLALLVAACIGEEPVATDPGPGQQPAGCIGIPSQTCAEIIADAKRNGDPGTVPVEIRAVCRHAVCTIQDGDAQVDIVYSNGRRDSFVMGWAAAPPANGTP